MILSLCDNPNILEVMHIIDIVITIIKIAVPIILIVSGMINYFNAVKDNDSDALSKANKLIVKKIIAAILIFFIPTFVNIIAKITENDLEYSSCITNATPEGISIAYKNFSDKYIAITKESLKETDYLTAYNYINQNIKNESDRNEQLKKLETVKSYIDTRNEIFKLQKNYDAKSYLSVKEKIDAIKDTTIKEKLQTEFEKIVKPVEGNPDGKKEKSSTMTYVVHAPKLVLPNMPLILYLHGDGGGNASGSSPFLSAAKKFYGNDLPFILVTPNGGMWAETGGRLEELKKIVDEECEKYKCDKTKISVAGHSRGSIGTWSIVSKYPGYFYSAVPVSCGAYSSVTIGNFVKTKIKAYAGTYGEAEQRYNRDMRSIVSKIKSAGGNVEFISLSGATHGTSPSKAFTKDTMEWMIN